MSVAMATDAPQADSSISNRSRSIVEALRAGRITSCQRTFQIASSTHAAHMIPVSSARMHTEPAGTRAGRRRLLAGYVKIRRETRPVN